MEGASCHSSHGVQLTFKARHSTGKQMIGPPSLAFRCRLPPRPPAATRSDPRPHGRRHVVHRDVLPPALPFRPIKSIARHSPTCITASSCGLSSDRSRFDAGQQSTVTHITARRLNPQYGCFNKYEKYVVRCHEHAFVACPMAACCRALAPDDHFARDCALVCVGRRVDMAFGLCAWQLYMNKSQPRHVDGISVRNAPSGVGGPVVFSVTQENISKQTCLREAAARRRNSRTQPPRRRWALSRSAVPYTARRTADS